MMWGWDYSDMVNAMSMTSLSGWAWVMYLQWLIIWGLLVALLAAAVRWLWKKGNK